MTLQVRIWLSLLLLLLGAYAAFSGWRVYDLSTKPAVDAASRGIERTRPTGSLADAKFVDTKNQAFNLDSLKGKVWVASFFFSSCPGPCAQMNRAIAALQDELTDADLKFVSITVDPDNDTPEHLAEYARKFQADPARWFFLTGPFADVQHLGTEVFQVAVDHKVHTERVMLVDRASKLRGLYWTSDPTQTLALKRKIAELLAEAWPAEGTAPEAEQNADPPAADVPQSSDTGPEPSSEVRP